MFGLSIMPNLNGKTKTGTWLGGTVTILFQIGILVYVGILIKALVNHTPVEKSS